MAYSFFVYGTVKNIPDYEGDKRVKLKTTATMFDSRKKAILFSSALLISPYLVLLILILSNSIEQKFSLLLLELPVISIICLKTMRAKIFEKLEKLHTYGFLYQVSLLSLTFLIITANVFSISIIVLILSTLAFILKTKIDSR